MVRYYQWEKVDDSECRLKDPSSQMIAIAYLIRNFNDRWSCRFYNADWDMTYYCVFEGIKTPDDAMRQATVWIYNTCNQVADSFHNLRDHLPSLEELRKQVEELI